MPIISVEILKIIDEKETQKAQKTKRKTNKDKKRRRGTKAIAKG